MAVKVYHHTHGRLMFYNYVATISCENAISGLQPASSPLPWLTQTLEGLVLEPRTATGTALLSYLTIKVSFPQV